MNGLPPPGKPRGHGWTEMPCTGTGKLAGARFFVADVVDERRRCACPRDICQNEATQEDLRCDYCRERCA